MLLKSSVMLCYDFVKFYQLCSNFSNYALAFQIMLSLFEVMFYVVV